jgi:glycosyltransferase involved in cell wall biosynthesis
LYVGNAYPHKNLDRLIKAFSLFRKEQSEDVQLLLVGKDDYFYKKLQEKLTNENYSGIIIKNNAKDSELAAYYKNAIALIAPSLMEGFGLPVLEALSSKCLVLASSIASFREVAKDAAIYFNPNAVGDINEKIKYAAGLDIRAKEKFVTHGFERSREFSWKRMALETLKVYESSISL